MADQESLLAAALADRYRIEREIGAGGMATVFLAQDLRHDRLVAIKIVRLELAEVLGADRFLQEIKTIAQLQHPHILPLFDSGIVSVVRDRGREIAIPYYVMPFVDGESLRARIGRSGPLPITEAIRVFREVADALAHAHRHGIVHRDIKPDNILLSDSHALVADFGVAKAVSAAAAGSSLTTVGMVIGTPAYMAPEQAAGDPRLDHRADIYALGVVGYEMVSGAEIFPGLTPQAVIAAHIAEAPRPLTIVAPGCPPVLAALIMRCLEKDPAKRPQHASEILAALETLTTGEASVARPARTRMRVWLAAAAGVVLLLAALFATGLLGGRSLLAQGVLEERDPILVADMVNRTRDSLLGLTMTEALRVDLTQSHSVSVAGASLVHGALSRMGRSVDEALDARLAREVAQRQGIKAFVTGEIGSAGSGYLVSVQLNSSATGEPLAAFRETARDSTEIIEAIGRVSTHLRRRIGESLRNVRSDQPLEQVTTSSLDALRKYSQAVRLTETEGDYDRANALLLEAVALDTGFAMAWRKLGVNLGNRGGRISEARHAVEKAFAHRDRLTERERYFTIGTYYTRVVVDPSRALDAYQSVLDIDPANMGALNNTALIYSRLRDLPKQEEYYRRALAADPNSGLVLFNLIETLIAGRKFDEAAAFTDTAALRFPSHSGLPWSRASLEYAKGNDSSALAIWQSIRAGAVADPTRHGGATETLAAFDALHGRLREAEALYDESIKDALKTGARRRALQRYGSEAAMDFWIRGDRLGGVQKLEAAQARIPLASMDSLDRPYLDLAYAFAQARRPDRARALLKEFETIDSVARADDAGFRLAVDAIIALDEGRPADAVSLAKSSMAIDPCRYCGYPDLGDAFAAAGQTDSAIAAYQQYLAVADVDKLYMDAFALPSVYRRLGDLYERKGDRANALDYYGRFMALWRNADSDLQPQVTEIRNRLAALASEEQR